jgi:hypothetical protein
MVSAFTYGTTNGAIVHELGWGRPRTTVDHLDRATKFDDEEHVVGLNLQVRSYLVNCVLELNSVPWMF